MLAYDIDAESHGVQQMFCSVHIARRKNVSEWYNLEVSLEVAVYGRVSRDADMMNACGNVPE